MQNPEVMQIRITEEYVMNRLKTHESLLKNAKGQ